MNLEKLSKEIEKTIERLSPATATVVTDRNVDRLIVGRLKEYSTVFEGSKVVIEPGEEHKNLESVERIWEELERVGATRKSLILNIGGGLVTDLGGFGAATFKRGIRYVNVPTTLLGAVDAATGGKTGINFHGLKNEVGAFHQPSAVIISAEPLATLPKEELLSGYGEMLKTALIADEELYKELADLPGVLGNKGKLESEMKRCVEIKQEIVASDPKEKGLRKVLNLGHTAGHAFESLSIAGGVHLPHGVEVAHGLLVTLLLSHMEQGFEWDEVERYSKIVREYFPPSGFREENIAEAIALMGRDKKNEREGEVNFTLLSSVGNPVINCVVSYRSIQEALRRYLRLCCCGV